MKTITIDVTQEDILAGRRCQPESCALTLAARRVLGDVWVDGTYLDPVCIRKPEPGDFEDDGDYVEEAKLILTSGTEIPLSDECRQFIRAFDRDPLQAKPFSFTVTLESGADA